MHLLDQLQAPAETPEVLLGVGAESALPSGRVLCGQELNLHSICNPSALEKAVCAPPKAGRDVAALSWRGGHSAVQAGFPGRGRAGEHGGRLSRVTTCMYLLLCKLSSEFS